MAEVKIQHAQFLYYVETQYTDPETQEEGTRLSRRIAMHGETVDIPRQEDIDRGEEAGAFVDEDEAAAQQEEQERQERIARGEEEPDDAEADADAANAQEAGGVPDINANHDELVAWVSDSKPNEDAMVNAAQGDPAMAQALMDAEEEASGGQPRKGVMTRLQAIVDNSAREQ